MPQVGDKVSVASKAGPRLGIVTASTGSMLQVRWETGEQSSIVPGPGTLTVVGKVRGKRLAKAVATTKSAPPASAATRPKRPTTHPKATPTSPSAKKRSQSKAAAKQTGSPKKASPPPGAKATVKNKKTSPDKQPGKRHR